MAINSGTSLEEDKQKASQDSGVFNSILNTVENVGGKVIDYAEDVGKDLFGTVGTAVKDTAKAGINLFTNLGDIKLSNTNLFKNVQGQTHDDFAIKQGEKLNSFGGIDIAKDILGLGYNAIIKPAKEFVFGNEITNNLKVDKDEFDKNITAYKSSLQTLDDKLSSIDKTKYNNYLTFQDNVYQQYLKDKNLTDIKDQNDFNLYMQQELGRLDGITQSNILKQQQDYARDTLEINQEKSKKEEELKTYLNNSINQNGDKTGEQIYNDYYKKEQDSLKNNEYINTINEIYNHSKEQVEDGLEAKGLAKVSDWAGYDSFKDSIVDDVAAENQYYMSLLGKKDLPNKDEIVNKVKEVNDVSLKFKLDYAKNFIDNKNDPKYKGMSELDLKNITQKQTWDNLSEQDKQTYKDKERVVTEVSALTNYKEFKDRLKDFNPKAIIDLVGGATSTLQSVIDQAYDYDTNDVPHYVKQDMRNIVYSGEGLGKNILSSITYNPDALITIFAGTKGLDKIAKVGTGIKSVVKALEGTDKIMRIPAKIGYGEGFINLTSKTIKNLTGSQLYGAVGDQVLDNVMEEAPTKGIEEFNQISNLLFDTTPFIYKEAKNGLEQSTSMNRIAYEFLNGDKKQAVQQFADSISTRTGTKIGLGEAKTILDNGVEGLYQTTFNPNKYKELLNDPAAMYKFVSDNVNNLSKDKLDAVLTDKGIGLKVNYSGTTGLTSQQQFDISDAFNKSLQNTIEGQFNKVKLNNLLDTINNSVEVGGEGKGFIILKDRIGNDIEEYSRLKKIVNDEIKLAKASKDIESFNKYIENANDAVKQIQNRYSNTKIQKTISLWNPLENKEMVFTVNDIEEFSQKKLGDFLKEGKVEFVTGKHSGTTFDIIDSKQKDIAKKMESFLSTKADSINKFEYDNGLVDKSGNGLNGYNKANGNDIRGTINKFVTGKLTSSVMKFSWIKDEKTLINTANFVNELIGDFINTDVKYIDKPIFINNEIEVNKETLMASGKQILDKMTKDNSYFNLTYGFFKDNKNEGNNIYLMYIMPGKKLLDMPIFKKYFNGLNDKGEVNPTVLRNQGNKLISSILKYSDDKGKINIEKGIIKSQAELSAGDISGYFKKDSDNVSYSKDEEGNYQLDELQIKTTVRTLISNTFKKELKSEVIEDFIVNSLKGFTPSQELLMNPIIHNLTYQYVKNKKLIDAVVSKRGTKEITKDIEAAFADILLSPDIRKSIKDNIVNKSGRIPDDYTKESEELLRLVNNETELYLHRLDLRKEKLILDKENLESYKKNIKDDVSTLAIDEEISIIENRISAIDKDLKYKKSLETKVQRTMFNKYIQGFIESKSLDASKTILGTSIDFLTKNISVPELKTLNDVFSEGVRLSKKITTLGEETKYKTIGYIQDVIDADGDSIKINSIIDGIKDKDIKQLVSEYVNLNKETPVSIDKKVIEGLFFKDRASGILQYEYAVQNNPLKKSLSSLISNSNTNRNTEYEQIFVKYFVGDNKINNIIDKKNIKREDIEDKDLILIGEDENKYKDKNGNIYNRVTSLENIGLKLSKESIEKNPENISLKKALYFGKKHKKIIEDFFEGKKINNDLVKSQKDFDKYIDKLNDFKSYIEGNGETIVGNSIKVKGLGIAGEISLLTKNKDNSLNIYQFFTRKVSKNMKEGDMNKYINSSNQINEYAKILKNKGFKVNKGETYLTRINYGLDDEKISNIEMQGRMHVDIDQDKKTYTSNTIDDVIQSEKFKEFKNIINFKPKEGSTTEDILKQADEAKEYFNKTIKEIFTNSSLLARKGDEIVDVTSELIEDIIKDDKVFQNIKSLFNSKKFTKKEKYIGDIIKKVGDKYMPIDEVVTNIPLQLEKMIDDITPDRLKLLVNYNNKYFQNVLGSKINKHYKTLLKEQDYKGYLSKQAIEPVIMFKEWFNNNSEKTVLELTNSDMNLYFGNLLDYKKQGYAFVAGFGDKDSGMHLYKAPDEILNLVSNKNEASEIYNMIEYAYSAGYVKADRKYKTHDDFLKAFVNNLGEKGKLDSKQLLNELEKFSEDSLIGLKDIRKRESFNTSFRKTFGEVKEDLNLFIIDELELDIPKGFDKFKNIKGISELSDKEIEDLLIDLDNIKNKPYGIDKTIDILRNNNIGDDRQFLKEFQTTLKNTFYNDMQDGTSFTSFDLLNLRGKLNGISLNNDEKKLAYRQFKDHFYGEIDGTRLGIKTLFNAVDITDIAGNKIPMSVAGGKSSLKLGKDIYAKGERTQVVINGRTYNATKIKGTDTSFFKNAGSDSFDFGSEVTMSDSIKSSLSIDGQKKITDEQFKDIQVLFDETIKGLLDPEISFSGKSDVDIGILKYISENKLGYSSSSFIGSKLDEFISGVNLILSKPKETGQSMFIYESNASLNLNEVIMHEDSELVKKLRGEVSKEKFGLEYKELSKDEKLLVDDNLFTVSYRYPVPSTYNIGTYKIKLSKDYNETVDGKTFNPYKDMGSEQVVLHPLATYMKLEGDNDGDHVFFLSSRSEMGKTLIEDTTGIKADSIDNLKTNYDSGKLYNDFIALEQVDKDKAIEKSETLNTLTNSRLAALNAKSYIGNVSATIRTIKNLGYMLGNKSKDLVPYIDNLGEQSYREINLIEELKSLDLTTPKLRRKFAAISAQLLQETLDFGNSGKSQFDSDWYNKLLDGIGISKDIQDELQARLITPGSMLYNTGLDYYSIPGIAKDILGNKKLEEKNNANKYLNNIVGSKKEILNKVIFDLGYKFSDINRGELKLYEIISAFNKPYDGKYIIKKVSDSINKLSKKEGFELLKDFKKKFLTINKKSGESYLKDFIGELKPYKDKWDTWYKKPNRYELSKINLDNILNSESIGDFNYGFTNLIDNKTRNFLAGPFEYLYAILKKNDSKIADKILEYIYQDNKKIKYELGKKLFDRILNEEDEDIRNLFSFLLYTGGEKKLINIIREQDWYNFLSESDSEFKNSVIKEGITTRDLFSDMGIKFPDEKDLVDMNEKLIEIDSRKKEIESLLSNIDSKDKTDDMIELSSEYETLSNQEDVLNKEIDKINILKETNGKYINQIKNDELDLKINSEYKIPGLDEQTIYIDQKGINYLIGESEGAVNKTRNVLTSRVSKFFEDYTPQFLYTYTKIRDMLGINNKDMLKAYDVHQLHFNEWYKYDNGIIRYLKNTGVNNYQDLARKIQYLLIDYKDNKFVIKDSEKMIKEITNLLDSNLKTKELINNEKFISALKDYQVGAIDSVSNILNTLEQNGYKVFDNYKGGEAYSLIIDTLEAHKSDAQLALRLNGFKNKDQFETFVMDKMIESGRSNNVISRGTMKTMSEVLYGGQGEWYDKVLGFLKGTHYSMNYGTMSLITGNGILSGVAQMLPNYVELQSYMRKNIGDIRQGFEVMQRYGLLDSESVLQFGTGIGKDFNNTGWLDGTLDKILRDINLPNIKGTKAASLLHSLLTNPLGGTDYPIETLRKMVAVSNTMKTFGIKNANDLDRKILLHGKDFEGLFRHRVSEAFAESGGGVNSSSAIYRDTIFNHLHNYADIWGVRFFTSTTSYLMGWSFRKLSTLIEKESTLLFGMKDLAKGNFKGFKAHMDDWFTYNSMIAHQAMITMGIYMKMEKYEKDTNDGITFDNFAKTFMNSVVSLNILLEKHLKAWETADEYSGTMQDKIGYTTVGFVRNMFRLFGQTNFIATMYKHYVYTQAEGKANLFNSLQFAMNEHYSAFIRFNGIDNLDNIYNSMNNSGKLAMLGTGASTETEEMIKEMNNGNYFGIYKSKGFIKGMYDMFDGLLLKSVTSVPAGLQNKISKDLVELVMKDPELSKLVRGGQFGTGKNDYNLEYLLGKSELITADQVESISEIYKQLSDYNYNYLDTTGIKKDSYSQSKLDKMLHEQIDGALKKEGINMQDLISKSNATPELLKTLAVLESKYGLKNPLVISLMIDTEYNKRLSEIKETKGRITGEVSKYGTAYKEVSEEDKIKLKRELLVKYQSYFNLNRQIGMDIIAQDIKVNHRDKLENLKNVIDKYGSSEKDMIQYIQSSYLIGQVAKEGDTSVSKLHSRYALAAKGLAANETSVKVANTFLNKLFNESGLSHKEKLANAAGFISGLDKATYGLLSNDETFNKLTDDSKKILMNRVFKINKEAIDYDSNNLLNSLNSNAYGGNGYSSYYKRANPKYKSSSFGGARPGFSNQFGPVAKLIPQRLGYLEKDPNKFIRDYNKPSEKYQAYNNLQSPIMREYKDLLIEQLFYGYKSRGIIKQKSLEQGLDKNYKKNIKLAKPRKAKNNFK